MYFILPLFFDERSFKFCLQLYLGLPSLNMSAIQTKLTKLH